MFHTITLPDIPTQVDPSDLKEEDKLLTADEITAIKSANLDNRRYTKAELRAKGINIKYHIIKKNDAYFAVYYGVSKGKEIYQNKVGTRSLKYAQNIDTGEWVVLKTEKSHEQIRHRMDWNLKTEKKGLKNADQLIVADQRENKNHTLQNEFLMKRAEGLDLHTLAQENKPMPAARWLDIFIASLEATRELHVNHRTLHRDLKPENIMCKGDKVSLVDFGMAVKVEDILAPLEIVDLPEYGTKGFTPPQIEIEAQAYERGEAYNYVTYNEKTELYSLARTFAEVLGLTKEFRSDNPSLLDYPFNPNEKQLINGLPRNEQDYSDARLALHKLFQEMLDSDPDKIPTLDEVIERAKSIREMKLNTESKILKIGYLDIDDFLGTEEEGYNPAHVFKQKQLLLALQSVDEIRLIGKEDNELYKKSLKVKKTLEDAGLSVQNEVLEYPEQASKVEAIKRSADNNERINLYSFNIFFSVTADNAQDYESNDILLIKAAEQTEAEKNYTTEIQNGISDSKISNINLYKLIQSILAKSEYYRQLDINTDLIDKLMEDCLNKISSKDLYLSMKNVLEQIKLYELTLIGLENYKERCKEKYQQLQDSELANSGLVENETLKTEIENKLNTLFSDTYTQFDQKSINEFFNKCDSKLIEIDENIAQMYKNIEDLRLEEERRLLETEIGKCGLRRRTLIHKLQIQNYEMMEILEKIILLENFKNTQMDLSFQEKDNLSFDIDHAYQLIFSRIIMMDEINTLISQDFITEESYQAALDKFTPFDSDSLKEITESIRSVFGDTFYAKMILQARTNLDSLADSEMDARRVDAYKLIEYSLNGHDNSIKNWRGELFAQRINEIINPNPDLAFNELEFQKYFLEYYNPAKQQYKPEYRDLVIDGRLAFKAGQAKKILAQKNLLQAQAANLAISRALKEQAVIDIDKQYQFNNYPEQIEKLAKYTHELNAAINKNKARLARGKSLENADTKKSAGKKLTGLEAKVLSQLKFLNDHWQEYCDNPYYKNEDNKPRLYTLANSLVSNTSHAKTALTEAENLIPLENRLLQENYQASKLKLQTLLFAFKNNNTENIRATYTQIIANIDELTGQYTRMQARKEEFLRKIKGGAIVKLINDEKPYIEELKSTRTDALSHIEALDNDESMKNDAYDLLELLDSLARLAITEEQRMAMNNKLSPFVQPLRDLIKNWEKKPLSMPDETISLKQSLEIASVKDAFKKFIWNEIGAITENDKAILDLMTRNNFYHAANLDDIQTNKTELNQAALIHEPAKQTAQSLACKFQRLLQIHLGNLHIEQAYRASILESSTTQIQKQISQIESSLEKCSNEDIPALEALQGELDTLKKYPENTSLNEFIQHHEKVEKALNDTASLISRIDESNLANEKLLLDELQKYLSIIDSMTTIPNLDINIKNKVENIQTQLEAMRIASNDRLQNSTPAYASEHVHYYADYMLLGSEFCEIINNHAHQLNTINRRKLNNIEDLDPSLSSPDLWQNYQMQSAIDEITHRAIQNLKDKDMPDAILVLMRSRDNIKTLEEKINQDIANKQKQISDTLISTLDAKLEKLKQIIDTLPVDLNPSLDSKEQVQPSPKDSGISQLQALNDHLEKAKTELYSTNMSYPRLDNLQSQIKDWTLRCDFQAGSLALRNVITKELDFLRKIDAGSEFIKKLEAANTKLLDLNLLNTVKELIDLKNDVANIIFPSLVHTLDEFAATKTPDTLHLDHLYNFLDKDTHKLIADYQEFLDIDGVANPGLTYKINKLIPNLKQADVYRSAITLSGSLSTEEAVDINVAEKINLNLDFTSAIPPEVIDLAKGNIKKLKDRLNHIELSEEFKKERSDDFIESMLILEQKKLQAEIGDAKIKVEQLSTDDDPSSMENTISSLELEAKRLKMRNQLRQEKLPSIHKIPMVSIEMEDKLPASATDHTHISDDEKAINKLSASAQKYFRHQCSTLEFTNALIEAAQLFEKYPENYEKLLAVAKQITFGENKNNRHEAFLLYQEFNQLLPKNLQLAATDLTEEKPIPILPPKPDLKPAVTTPAPKQAPAINTSQHFHAQALKILEPISYSDLSRFLHDMNLFMTAYDGDGIKNARVSEIHKLQQHVLNIHGLIHQYPGHPLYKPTMAMYNDLFTTRGGPKATHYIHQVPPADFRNHYHDLKIAGKDLENFANLYVGSKQKGIASITKKALDLAGQAEMDMRSSDKNAKSRLDEILKDSEELRARINIIITKKEESSAPAILDELRQSAATLSGIIDQLNSHQAPTEVMTYSTGKSQYITLDQASKAANLDKIVDAMKMQTSELHSIESMAVQAMPTDRRLRGGEFRLDAPITYAYEVHDESGGMFASKTEYTRVSTGVGTVNDMYMAILAYNGSIKDLRPDQHLIIAAHLVNKYYDELPEDQKKMKFKVSAAMPPEITRAITAYCKLSNRKYPEPDTYAVYMKPLKPAEQKKYDKEMEAYLQDKDVVEQITSFSADVILSAAKQAEKKQKVSAKLDKMRGEIPGSPKKGF